jgi:tryptophanyl-tRNA synthetase
MFTDPQRMRKNDPGRPERCNVFSYHGIYSTPDDVENISAECKNAGIGCTECKKRLADRISEAMKPIYERQDYYRNHMDEVRLIMDDGNARAAGIARKTMEEVREAVKI